MVINDGQPLYCVERAMHILNRQKKAINGSRILVLGIAYKQDIDDYRESPAIRVIEELKKVGADVDYHDPWIQEFQENGRIVKGLPQIDEKIVSGYDLIMITTAHSNVDYHMIQRSAKIVFDTKNVTKNLKNRDNIEIL